MPMAQKRSDTNQCTRTNKSAYRTRAGCDAGADESNRTGYNEQELASLERIGRARNDGAQNALYQREDNDDPGLGLCVVEVGADVCQLVVF